MVQAVLPGYTRGYDYVLSGAYKTQPSFQRYLQGRVAELAAQGIHVDLME
jgi:hypothetical protein